MMMIREEIDPIEIPTGKIEGKIEPIREITIVNTTRDIETTMATTRIDT